MFAPFLERAAASLVYFKGFTFRGAEDSVAREDYPNVNKWWAFKCSIKISRVKWSEVE